MPSKESDYDFLCNNDTRQIKLAIQGDAFFAAAIQSETAKKIDLSGGTKHVEGITFAHCLKLTRIIWPENTGAIKRLAIHSADSLATLDLSSLTNLEELSVFNCAELESVTGLGKTIKVVNLHGVNLKSLDVSQAKGLEKLNIQTISPVFTMTAKHCDDLQLLLLQGEQLKLSLQQCPSLVSLLISNSPPLELNITACPNITDVSIAANESSVITGLEECKKAQLHELTSSKTAELKKLATDFIAPILQHKAGPEDMETVIQKYGTIRERNHTCIIMISLLSSMDKTLTLELEKLDIQKQVTTQKPHTLEDLPELMVFLPETNIKITERNLQLEKRFPNKQAEIINWLTNANKQQENLLLLNKRDIKNLEIFNLLKQIEHKRQLLLFMGKQYPMQYRLPLMNRIIADFPRRLLTRTAPHLFDTAQGTSALPPIAAAPPVIDAPTITPTTRADTDKRLSDSALQRMMSETLRMLDLRNPIKKEMLRRHSNALRRLIAARNHNERINALLRQTQQARVTAAAKTIETKKQLQPGTPIDAPPQLVDAANITLNPIDVRANPENLTQDLHIQRKGKPIEAPPELFMDPESPAALKDIREDINIEEYDLSYNRKYGVEGAPIGQEPVLIGIPPEETPTLLNLEQANKIKLELGIAPAPAAKQKAEGSTISAPPSLIDEAERISALENLQLGTEYFADTLTAMTQEAKVRAKPEDTVMQPAVLIIEKSIATSLTNLSYAKKISDMTVKSEKLLDTAQELTLALKKLNEACESAFKAPKPQPTGQSERDQLIDLLDTISEQYLQAHRVKDQSSGVFGTGYHAGVHAARLKMLNSWLYALRNNQSLPLSTFNSTLTELSKDKMLNAALEPAVELLRKYVTSAPKPTKRKS